VAGEDAVEAAAVVEADEAVAVAEDAAAPSSRRLI
jgi:hypothetical protein